MHSLKDLADDWRTKYGTHTMIASHKHGIQPMHYQDWHAQRNRNTDQALEITRRHHPIGLHFIWREGAFTNKNMRANPIVSLCIEHLLKICQTAIVEALNDHRWRHNHMMRFQLGKACHQASCLQAIHHANHQTTNYTMLMHQMLPLLSTLATLQGAKGLLQGGLRETHTFAMHLVAILQEGIEHDSLS